jgi:hypothetical protein
MKGRAGYFFHGMPGHGMRRKKLSASIDKINCKEYRENDGTPILELAPLHASAYFANAIESIFSSRASSIIHK